MMMVVMVVRTTAHRAVRTHSHPPAAKPAERIVEGPRTAIPIKRAGKQAADEGQYNNE